MQNLKNISVVEIVNVLLDNFLFHGLDINLTMKLAKTFQSLGLESEAESDGDLAAEAVARELISRAGLYYSASLAGLDRIERGAPIR